jgi:hypothetical protein
MDAGSLPAWAQAASLIAIALVSSIIGVIRYLKTDAKDNPPVAGTGTASVVSASFVDSKLLKELIETLREHQDEMGRDAKRTQRILNDHREALCENTEALIVQTDTTGNMLRFLNRNIPKKERLVDVEG